jgi:hypothetical protein
VLLLQLATYSSSQACKYRIELNYYYYYYYYCYVIERIETGFELITRFIGLFGSTCSRTAFVLRVPCILVHISLHCFTEAYDQAK